MRRHLRTLLCLCLLLYAGTQQSHAHVGAPDVYVKATAGPYQLMVSVHPPAVIPGAAGVDVRTDDPGVRVITVALPGGAPQTLQRFSTEQIFMGSVWVATGGAWRVVIHVKGTKGEGEATVPVPRVSDTTTGIRRYNRPQWWGLGLAVVVCGLLLLFRHRRFASVIGLLVVAAIFIAAIVVAAHRPRRPGTGTMQVTMLQDGQLQLVLPGTMDDLVDDHGHKMHLFAVRQPQMDVILHLHPQETVPGQFEVSLPSMAPGAFLLFADVVHQNGTLQTFTAQAGLPPVTGHVLQGDDSVGVVPGLAGAQPVTGPATGAAAVNVRLMDGYTMRMELASVLHPRSGQMLRFTLLDPAGAKPSDMQLYMGMTAHAAVVKTDGKVFAHIHPAGTIPMAAMAGMDMSSAPESEVSFPFGFPSAGNYRIFVQMKHGSIIETGAFDLLVR